MPDLYGAPTGLIAAGNERRAKQLHDLSMAKGELELDAAKTELARQKQMLTLMEQSGLKKRSSSANVEDLATDMDGMADIAMRSGLPEKAKEFALAGSTLRRNQQEVISKKLAADVKQMDFMSSLLQSVDSEDAWRKANDMFAMQTGQRSPWSQMPYNPELVVKLQAGIQSAKDRALTSAAKAREAASKAQVNESSVRTDLLKAQTRLADARAEKLRKIGGQEPKAADLRAITDLLQKDFGGGVSPEEARVLARPVAERMLEMISRQNLSKSEAAQRAYQEAKGDGAFGGIRPRHEFKGTAKRPLDIPSDKAKLKPNMYYKGTGRYEGKIFLWTGTGFIEPEADEDFEEFPDEETED